jgi:hypothetical protein
VTAVRHAAAALVIAAAALLAISSLHAAGLRVVLIGPSADDPTVARVRQELVLLGLDVEVVTPAPGADLAVFARERDAAAAARVETSPPEIVLWVDEAHSAGLPQESRISEPAQGSVDPGLLALRAVELLRGRLLPVPASPSSSTAAPSAPPPPSSTVAPAPSSARPDARPAPPPRRSEPRSRLSLHTGPALAVSPGGVPPMPALRVGAAWRVVAPIEIDALIMIPLAPGTVGAAEGLIDLRVIAFGAGAAARWADVLPGLSLHAGAGAGAAGFLFQGHAAPPWLSASGDRWSALPFVAAGAGYHFTPVVAARLDLLAALALPPPVLVIAAREVASFGAPAVFASLSVEVHP